MALSIPVNAAEQVQGPIKLKDGSTLQIDKDGSMRMFDVTKRPIMMKDNVPMEAEDGSVIMMKEHRLWKEIRLHGTLSGKSSH
jgi:hypothetical protein